MLHTVGPAIYKRAFEAVQEATLELPWWTSILMIGNFFLLVPFCVFLFYTLNHLYPLFVIVEDENAPAYEPLSASPPAYDDATKAGRTDVEDVARPRAIGSSIRSIKRNLQAHGGFLANFRGLSIYMTNAFLTSLIVVSVTRFFGTILGLILGPFIRLAADLLLVQLSTAWVHIAITPKSSAHFWQRLPPFTTTLKAVWRPMVLSSLASFLAGVVPILAAGLVSYPTKFDSIPQGDDKDAFAVLSVLLLKHLFVIAISAVAVICLTVPTSMILVRVQASLLPVDEDAIVPFDRTFGGRVQNTLVGGRGFATISDVWSTFSRTTVRRLVGLYIKLTGIAIVSGMALGFFVFGPEVLLVLHYSKVVEGGN